MSPHITLIHTEVISTRYTTKYCNRYDSFFCETILFYLHLGMPTYVPELSFYSYGHNNTSRFDVYRRNHHFPSTDPNHEGSVFVALHQSDCRRGLICFVLCSGQYCLVFGGLMAKITPKLRCEKKKWYVLRRIHILKSMHQHHIYVTVLTCFVIRM